MRIFGLYLLLMLFSSCGQRNSESSQSSSGPTNSAWRKDGAISRAGYKLTEPAHTFLLPAKLLELSGLQSLGNTQLACVQDEDGSVFLFNLEHERVDQEIVWGSAGDYEGIAGKPGMLYVLESKGTLIRLSGDLAAGQAEVKKYEIKLERKCNAEGIALSADGQYIYLVCKGGRRGLRNIWRFNLQNEKLEPHPFIEIAQKVLEREVLEHTLDRIIVGIRKIFHPSGESGVFSPSGIAVHPKTGDLYILSAASKLLVVLSLDGEVKRVEELSPRLFPQAEAITFAPNGDLYVGNEGKGEAATILFFPYLED